MRTKIVVEESLEYYKKPVLLIATIGCSFKCCKEANIPITVCINEEWAAKPVQELPNSEIITRYANNPICQAICFGGLEPFDQFEEILNFIHEFRVNCQDDIVIYTGYTEDEVADQVSQLAIFPHILIKFGRFKPDQPHHVDPLLGVELASPNQYAKWIS